MEESDEPVLSRPREKTIKRLFAVSRNRCAFPKCSRALVAPGGTVVGEICHIKARNDEGPRHDKVQTPEERHGYENLLLLCPEHHAVIDDLAQGYTVEMLLAMKREHEDQSMNVDVDAIATQLLEKANSGTSVIQHAHPGGVAIAATHSPVTIHMAPPVAPKTTAIRNDAAQALWRGLLRLRSSFPPVLTVLDCATEAQYALAEEREAILLEDLRAQLDTYLEPLLKSTDWEALDCFRPYLPVVLWDRFAAYRAFLLRVCHVAVGSRTIKKCPWFREAGSLHRLEQALGSRSRMDELMQLPHGRLLAIREQVEGDFLAAIRRLVDEPSQPD